MTGKATASSEIQCQQSAVVCLGISIPYSNTAEHILESNKQSHRVCSVITGFP